jgi:hypothetical protein
MGNGLNRRVAKTANGRDRSPKTRYAVDPLRAGLDGSNAQHEQRHEADSGEQRRECHGIVFEPMPIRKHDVHPLFERHFS